MRIWDLDVSCLCRQHLLGEHRELHAIWSILTQHKKGYRNHPEVKRWEKHLGALDKRHDAQVHEMLKRGYKHNSRLLMPSKEIPAAHYLPPKKINTLQEQRGILVSKGCECRVKRRSKAFAVRIEMDLVICGDEENEIDEDLIFSIARQQFDCVGPDIANEMVSIKRILTPEDIPGDWRQGSFPWNDGDVDLEIESYIPHPLEALAEQAE